MPAHVFHELTGFNLSNAQGRVQQARADVDAAGAEARDVRVSIAPHAPYSVSPALFAAIREDLDAQPRGMSSVHLGESPGEVELLRHGTGVVRAMLERLGVWTDAWQVPGASPVAYLTGLGFLDSRVLVVHGVQFEGDDLSRLSSLGATLVSCPRSNRHVGVGSPPIDAFYAMDVRVAFGTDSLASAPDLDMFAELAEARRVAPRVPARLLLESATLSGARALGFGEEMGSLDVGKRAALIAVDVPDDVVDVEEYLVSGIASQAIAWIEAG
jgi:cytosine/adenosine deaminase-related metal-dependent hydrolase